MSVIISASFCIEFSLLTTMRGKKTKTKTNDKPSLRMINNKTVWKAMLNQTVPQRYVVLDSVFQSLHGLI